VSTNRSAAVQEANSSATSTAPAAGAPAAAAPAAAAPAGGTPAGGAARGAPGGGIRNLALNPPVRVTVGKNVGLHISYFVYRAPADAPVTFDPIQIKAWEDTRAGANSPWAPIWTAPDMPADGKVPVRITFSQPGTYIIRGVADDGALTGGDEVTVTVSK
jgi:hypothetical protein